MRALIKYLLIVICLVSLAFIAWKIFPLIYEPAKVEVKPLDGRAMIVDPSDDPNAAQCQVEVVVTQQEQQYYVLLVRVKSPNKTEVRCAEIALAQQGFIRATNRSRMQLVLTDEDGWSYMYDTFTSPERD